MGKINGFKTYALAVVMGLYAFLGHDAHLLTQQEAMDMGWAAGALIVGRSALKKIEALLRAILNGGGGDE